MGNAWERYAHPEVMPDIHKGPTFDANYGFSGERQQRVMIATDEEMRSAKIPLESRDYCAHKLITYMACRKDTWPFVYRCHHEKHDYGNCMYEDYVLRMKEFERERRLLERKNRAEIAASG